MRDQNIVADSVHNIDMVSFDGDGDHAVELWSPTPALEAVYRMHGMARGIPVSAVPFESSDHQSFLDRGFPTVGVCEEFVGGDFTSHYHRVTDTYDKIDFTYLTRVTRYLLVIFEDRAVND
jgi:Zn-dependent M28 family amino/carboxypeptidase